MDVLEHLAMALGLSALAGINLYLTVFVVGLAIQQQWITLAPQYESLAVLGEPTVVILAGIFYFCEFFADKVPWVDSAWDAVHTAIRPIGAALISIQVLGEPSPVFSVIAGLLGGSVALTTHAAKSATRLLVNTSPEPFSNVGVSLSEDAAVVGGLALLYFHPVIGIAVCVVAVALTLYLFPKLWRAIRVTLFLLFRKIRMGAVERHVPLSELRLPARYESHFSLMNPDLERVRWAAPVITRRGPGLPRNVNGYLVASAEEANHLYFLSKSRFSPLLRTIPVAGGKVRHETRFLLEELHLFHTNGSRKHFVFALDRSKKMLAAELAQSMEQMTLAPPTSDDFSPPTDAEPTPESHPEPTSVSRSGTVHEAGASADQNSLPLPSPTSLPRG